MKIKVLLYFVLVGHGRSGGERAYIEDFSVYVMDVVQHIQDLKVEHPDVPMFLMGHSMVR